MRRSSLAVLLFMLVASAAGAQSGATPASPNDSVFRRARRLVSDGNGAAGRALVDSVLNREQEGGNGFGDALYWRGALAETAADAERDYRRVIVEYPLSAYVDDALLAMAELEQARGDRAGALQHLQRFVREHPASTARGTAAFAGARLAFELGDTRVACGLITDARTSVAPNEVELRNQIDYYASRCPSNVAAAQTPPTAVALPATPSRRPTATVPMTPPAKIVTAVTRGQPAAPLNASAPPAAAPRTIARKSAEKPIVMFTVQLAAYSTLPEARALIAKLERKGVHARVSGTSKPFRVRLALHPTRQAATAERDELKAKSIIGFVTTEERTPEQNSP
ncbi:MAG: SPOR domain-containing protein [Gemmatimonadota bacterium]|nr:SPOR domain-containing protein [Gemmatimonadota bacterium]